MSAPHFDRVQLSREFHGLPNPHSSDVKIPGPVELYRLCSTAKQPQRGNIGLAYPADNPVFWIKYGHSVVWGEMHAQHLAHQELQRLNSPVRVPAVYYACQLRVPSDYGNPKVYYGFNSYVVMDYIPGKTARDYLDAFIDDDQGQDRVYAQIALAVSELLRIPVPQGTPPMSIHGELIRHPVFDMDEAPRKYDNVQQLEDQINAFFPKFKRQERIRDLAREPMVFCYSDVWLDNFILDQDANAITVIDFSETAFLPSSFAKYVLAPGLTKIKRDISGLVTVPSTEGVDNMEALHAVHGPMVMGWSGFVSAGVHLFGRQPPPEEGGLTDLLDDNGDPIVIPRREKGPPTPPGGTDWWLSAANLPPIKRLSPTSTPWPPILEDTSRNTTKPS